MMYTLYKRRQGAAVLIAVIGVLAVLSLMAATFGIIMRVEMAASENQTEHEQARHAAHAGCEFLITSLRDYLQGRASTPGILPNFSPNPNDPFGCQLVLRRNGLKAYYVLCEHPGAAWTDRLGTQVALTMEAASFNLNAHGHAADLGSPSNYAIRYTSFDTSLVRLLKACFDYAVTDPDFDAATIDSCFANFSTSSDERQRVAILVNKAAMDWRHGDDAIPGNPYTEAHRLGHLPRWSATLACSAANAGIGYPGAPGWGAGDGLPSLYIERKTSLNDCWSYAEPGIWLTNQGSVAPAPPYWANDIGVASSGAFWGKVLLAQFDAVSGQYTVDPDTSTSGWRDWTTGRWANAFVYVGSGEARGWYIQITNNVGNKLYLNNSGNYSTDVTWANWAAGSS